MIHSLAQIHPDARLADDVEVGPWSIVGPDVVIGQGTVIGPHVVVKGPTEIGKNNRIFQFSSIGEDCQDKKYQGEPTRLVIGDHNVIREACTIHRGTVQDRAETRIGNHNLLMVNVHIAHDVQVADHVIIANNAAIAGHVVIDDYAVLGGFAAVHQFCRIGAHSMCGAGSVILKDVPAFVTVNGNTAKAHGINVEGLRRRGFEQEAIATLKRAYKLVFRQGLTIKTAIQRIHETEEARPELDMLIESLRTATRGIVR